MLRVVLLIGGLAVVLFPDEVLAETPCPKDSPPEWCDPTMIPLTIVDAQGRMEARHSDGAQLSWSRPGWKGLLRLRLKRERSGTRVSYSTVTEESVKTVYVKTGGTLVLAPGRDVPADWFGKNGDEVKLIIDHSVSAK